MKKMIVPSAAMSMLLFMCCTNNGFAASHPVNRRNNHSRSHHVVSKKQLNSLNRAIVDINSASLALLESIKGIGTKKAQAIMSYRKKHGHFVTLDALAKVKGISQHSVQRLLKNNPGRLIVKN